MFATVQHLRHPDGSYWTGWQYANEAHFPAERSSWTAAAVVLAADALTGLQPAARGCSADTRGGCGAAGYGPRPGQDAGPDGSGRVPERELDSLAGSFQEAEGAFGADFGEGA